MSNFGQGALAVVGGVIGFFVGGGPTGAMYGFQLGLLAGTAIFPTQLPHVFGPRMEDLQTTASQLGVPMPMTYGTIAVPGFVIYLGCVEEVATTEEVGGKGGPEQDVTTYTYFQTLALGLVDCINGPIAGIWRVWENGELKYDARVQQEDETDDDYAARLEMSSEYAATFSLYLGDEAQEPDPTLEEEVGIGNVPAFRGLAYLVFPRRQLLDTQARRHPVFRVETYKAVSVGRQVVPPTVLPDTAYDSWQISKLMPDWAHNRYFTVDFTGGTGLRVFSILDNTEQAQYPLDSLGILLFNGWALDSDGNIWMSYYTAGNTVTISKFSPTFTLLVSASFSGASAAFLTSWQRTANVVQHGVQQNRNYLLWNAVIGHNFCILTPALTLVPVPMARTDGLVCRGAVSGHTSYGWLLAYSPGTSASIRLIRVTFSENSLLEPSIAVEDWDTIELSDIDSSWAAFALVAQLCFDETDDTLIFGMRNESVDTRYIKYDPATKSIVWLTTEVSIDLSAYSDSSSFQQLRGSYLAVGDSNGNIDLIDVRTGETEVQDWSDDLNSRVLGGGVQVFSSVYDAIIAFISPGGDPNVIFLNRRIPGPVSLATIVRDVWDQVGGDEDDIDVADLESRYVLGYAITRPVPARGAIEPLRPLGPFDGVESEGLLKFPTRGKAIVRSILETELGAAEDGKTPPPAVVEKEMQDVEQPRRVRVRYISEARDYEPGEQLSPTRISSSTVNEKDIEIPVAILDDMAAQTAEILWAEAWLARWQYETTLDAEFLALDPADCIGLPVDNRVFRTRIIDIGDSAGGLLRKLQLLKDDDGSYTSTAVADPPLLPVTRIAIYSATGLLLLDLPPIRDEDDDAGIYAAAYRTDPDRSWNGTVIHRSNDGATYSVIGSITTEATVAQLVEDLPAGVSTVWDYKNELVIDVLSGSFSSASADDIIENRVNAVAVGAHGRWEILQFQDATQEGERRFRLSTLLRGRRATEHNIGTAIAGDFVVLLAGGIGRLGLQLADIDVTKYYKAVTINTQFSSADAQSFAGEGEALKPFSPVNIHGTRNGSNDLTISWTRRGRFGYSMMSGVDIPLSEATESYSVDIVNGGSPEVVLRTIASTVPNIIYTAAQQLTDGLTPGDPVSVKVYQLSATVGRGHAGEATI